MNVMNEQTKTVSEDETQPWHRLGGIEHVCELRKLSTILYGIFAEIVRLAYGTKEGRIFGCPDVVWDPNPDKTGIWIDTELRWEDKHPNKYPAVFVQLGELQSQPPSGIYNGRVIGANREGSEHQARMVSGQATLVHVSTRAGEACALADNTENYISFLEEPFRKEFCFGNTFRVMGRQPLQKLQTSPSNGQQLYTSSVIIAFTFLDEWDVRAETPILKSIRVVEPSCGQKPESDGRAERTFDSIVTEIRTPNVL